MTNSENYYLMFDFDGTLVDSFYTVLQNLEILSDEFHFKKINLNDRDMLKNLTSKELIKYLQIPFYRLPRVLRRVRESMHEEILTLPLFSRFSQVLSELKNLNCSLGILTSNSLKNVEAWLQHHHIYHLFDFIHAESSYFGKKHLLKALMKKHEMKMESTFYIGDETRDIEAAKKCNIHSIAVSWGFNSETTLQQCNPCYMARKPEDILQIIKEKISPSHKEGTVPLYTINDV
jgi:phosphoglycolate phosphatase